MQLNLEKIFRLKTLGLVGAYYNMVNDVGEGNAGNKANNAAKKLNTTNINRKGAGPNRKINLPLNRLFL